MNCNMTDTIELRKVITSSGLKYGHIAKKLGLTAFGLQKKIENKTEFKASEISAICSLLSITDNKVRDRLFFANHVEFNSTK